MEMRIKFYLCATTALTCLVVMAVSVIALREESDLTMAILCQLLVLALFIVVTYPGAADEPNWQRTSMLLLLLPIVFAMSWWLQVEFFFIYTIIWIACSPAYFSRRYCWWWLGLISLAWYIVRLIAWQEDYPLAETLLIGTFHLFALLSAITADESAKANEKTQALNRELLATQHLLSEASRDSERNRIARDLHDLLGHHLTALTINLQLASRITEGEAKERVEQCHALAKLLLSDVRDAVSTLREMPAVNLQQLFEIAVKDIPKLEIKLDIDRNCTVNNVNTSEALLRALQEAITNTLRHSRARKVSVAVTQNENGIQMSYQDDGQGCAKLHLGNGLTGMRERIERLNGNLNITSTPHMQLNIVLPHGANV